MIIFVVIVFCLLIAASHIMNFPGGPTGFAVCTKMWIKEKRLALMSKSLKKHQFINQCAYKQRASQTFHPRQRQAQSQSP